MSPFTFAEAFLVPANHVVDWTALDQRFDWIRAMKDAPQDPIHHAEGDVWIHTRMVAEAMTALDRYRKASEDERAVLFASALLHDVAKPTSTQIGEDGRITSKGHSTKGASLARQILWRAKVPFAMREMVVAMTRHHQAPFWLLEREDPRELAIRISQTARCDLLALLAEADARGRTCEDQQRLLDNINLFVEYVKEQGCLDKPFEFPSAHTRFLWCGGRQRDPLYEAHESFRCEVTLMSGFPGAGKDHYVAENLSGLPVVSLDRLRHDLDVDPEDDQGTVVQAAREEAREHLRAGRSFVWNATNLSRKLRSLSLRLFADYDARVKIVYVEVDEETLRAQNRARAKAQVPERVIESLLSKWDVPDLTEAHEVEYVIR